MASRSADHRACKNLPDSSVRTVLGRPRVAHVRVLHVWILRCAVVAVFLLLLFLLLLLLLVVLVGWVWGLAERRR